jgi:hypothetical protein
MGHTFQDWERTEVRRKGTTDTVGHRLNHSKQITTKYGERRSRQIAERHWLKKESECSTATSGGAGTVSTKPPGGVEVVKVLWQY